MGSYKLHWEPLLGGFLAIGHRPGKALRKRLDETGCTRLVSLLSFKEQPDKPSTKRIRLPLQSADPPGKDRISEVLELFAQMKTLLEEGEKVYLHCSAGLHRTGMITYAFLRHLGYSQPDAIEKLTALRALTAEQAGSHRLAWGEQFA